MSRRNKTFYDVYSELWELLDKPHLRFWQRMRVKQLLNQLLRLHDTHIFTEIAEKRIADLEAKIEKMQEKLKADLIARLEEQMQYSTSPSCTKGMELFIKSIEEWEIKEK